MNIVIPELTPEEMDFLHELKAGLSGGVWLYRNDDALVQKALDFHNLLKVNGKVPLYLDKLMSNHTSPRDFYKKTEYVYWLVDYFLQPITEDQTIDNMFTVDLLSGITNSRECFFLKRTLSGWNVEVHFLEKIVVECDIYGAPHLYDLLNEIKIIFPYALPSKLGELWFNAFTKGLNRQQVETELARLIYWVSEVGKAASTNNIRTPFESGVVSVLDILGWQGIHNKVHNPVETLNAILIACKQGVERPFGKFRREIWASGCAKTKIISISDTIVIITPCRQKKEDYSLYINLHGFIMQFLFKEAAKNKLFLRGTTACGNYHYEENIFTGDAIDEAMSWYEQCDWIGCHLAPSAAFIYEAPGDDEVRWMEYQPPFKEKLKYKPKVLYWSPDGTIDSFKELCISQGPLPPNIIDKYVNTFAYLTSPEKARVDETIIRF